MVDVKTQRKSKSWQIFYGCKTFLAVERQLNRLELVSLPWLRLQPLCLSNGRMQQYLII